MHMYVNEIYNHTLNIHTSFVMKCNFELAKDVGNRFAIACLTASLFIMNFDLVKRW